MIFSRDVQNQSQISLFVGALIILGGFMLPCLLGPSSSWVCNHVYWLDPLVPMFFVHMILPYMSSSPKKNKAFLRLITDQQNLSNKSPSKEILKTALGCCFQETVPWFLTLRFLSHRSCSWLGNSSQNSEYLDRSLSYLWWTVLSQRGERGCCNIPSI